jgi:hypothetical protein
VSKTQVSTYKKSKNRPENGTLKLGWNNDGDKQNEAIIG